MHLAALEINVVVLQSVHDQWYRNGIYLGAMAKMNLF